MGVRKIGDKAQNLVEYAMVLGIIALALFGMRTYFQRGIQGLVKVVADDLGPQGEPFKDEKEAREKKQIDTAIKAIYGRENKTVYKTESSQKTDITNYGKGKIRRDIESEASFSEDSL